MANPETRGLRIGRVVAIGRWIVTLLFIGGFVAIAIPVLGGRDSWGLAIPFLAFFLILTLISYGVARLAVEVGGPEPWAIALSASWLIVVVVLWVILFRGMWPAPAVAAGIVGLGMLGLAWILRDTEPRGTAAELVALLLVPVAAFLAFPGTCILFIYVSGP